MRWVIDAPLIFNGGLDPGFRRNENPFKNICHISYRYFASYSQGPCFSIALARVVLNEATAHRASYGSCRNFCPVSLRESDGDIGSSSGGAGILV